MAEYDCGVIFSAGVIGVSFRGAVVSSGDVQDEARHIVIASPICRSELKQRMVIVVFIGTKIRTLQPYRR